jgi:hypothetical protein
MLPLFLLSHAGNWLFSSRRWLDPLKPRDRARLEGNFEVLCDAFPPFAAHCKLANYLETLLDISTAWNRVSSDHDTFFTDPCRPRRSLADDEGMHRNLGLPLWLLEPSSRDPASAAPSDFSKVAYASHRLDDARRSQAGPVTTKPVPDRLTAATLVAEAPLSAGREQGGADFMLLSIPPDFIARGDGYGATAYRPCRDAFEPDDGCGPLSRRLGDGPDRPGQGVYSVAAAGRGTDASHCGAGGVGPCLPRLRLIFPALLRPALDWPALKSPPPLQSPSGDSVNCGDSGGPAFSAGSALPTRQVPRKRHAAEWAEEDCRRAKVGGSAFAPGLRPLPTGRPQAAAPGQGDEDLAAEAAAGQVDGGGQAGGGSASDPVRRSLATAAADAGQGRAAWTSATGGGPGGPSPFADHFAGSSDLTVTTSRCWAGPTPPQELQAAPGDGYWDDGPAANGGGPGTGGSAFEPVRRPPARVPARHAAAGAAGGTPGAGVSSAPPSAFRVVRPAVRVGL